MGCWNATCCLSNLPITYGEEIYVWAIAQNVFAVGDIAGNCSTNDMYHPISFAIEGKYDDYGSVESIVPGVSVDYIEAMFDNEFLTYSHDADKRDIAQEPIEWSMKTIERGKVLYCANKPADFFIARKDVTDKLCSIADKVMADYPPAYEGMEDSMSQLCRTDEDIKKEFGVTNVDEGLRAMVLYTNKFLRIISDINRLYLRDFPVKKMFMSFMKDRNLTERDRHHLLLTIKMDIILFKLRKCWLPQPSGAGSQAWDVKDMRHFCEVVTDVCNQKLKGH